MHTNALSRRDAIRLAAALSLSAAVPATRALAQTPALRPSEIRWDRIQPGTEVIIRDGEYDDLFVIMARGTPDAPITVRPETPGGAVFGASIVMHASINAVLDGMTVRNSEHSGVILQEGSENVTVTNCELVDCGLGIWIGNKSSDGHRLIGNRIIRSQTMGIAIDMINARPDNPTLIERNYIEDSAYHGMELHGNYYVVLHNEVHGSGANLSGCSGIHTFCRKAEDPHGKHNVIAYNVATGTTDLTGNDGNGIQADQWCNDNLIAFNLCQDCDGAGINIYDAFRTTVFNNTLIGNMRDSGGSHAYRAELSLAADYPPRQERPVDNRVYNNAIIATNPEAVAIYVEKTAGAEPQEFGNNLVHHAADGALFYWGPTDWRGTSPDEWNGLKFGAPDIAEGPDLDAVSPLGKASDTLALLSSVAHPALHADVLVEAKLITEAEAKQLVIGAAQPNG